MTKRTHIALATALLWALGIVGCSGGDTSPEQPTLDSGPTIVTWAGTGVAGFDGDGNSLAQSNLYWPTDVEFTPTRGTFFVDWNNHRIRKLMPDGTLMTVIGSDLEGDGPDDESDHDPPGAPGTECKLNHPTHMVELRHGPHAGKILLTCWHNYKIRLWDPDTDRIYILCGREFGYQGDGEDASEFGRVNQPQVSLEGSDGSIYILDQRNLVFRRIDTNNVLSTVAGVYVPNGQPGGYNGDGRPPMETLFNFDTNITPQPSGGFVIDKQDNFYVADAHNHLIRKVDFANNVVTNVAGTPQTPGYSGDGGAATKARLNNPNDLAWGPDGKLYIADEDNNAVRVLDLGTGIINTVAGSGVRGYSGDGGPAREARLDRPRGLSFDSNGDLYIADTVNNVIRKVIMEY